MTQGYLAHKKHPPPRTLQWSYGGELFLMSEVPLYGRAPGRAAARGPPLKAPIEPQTPPLNLIPHLRTLIPNPSPRTPYGFIMIVCVICGPQYAVRIGDFCES